MGRVAREQRTALRGRVTRGVLALALASLPGALGCGSVAPESSAAEGADAVGQLERRALGKAQPYAATNFTASDEERFATSKKARRELGWTLTEKVLKPVPIAEQTAIRSASDRSAVPAFRTWLGGDEFERMFSKMLADLGKDRRLKRDAPTAGEVESLFDWNSRDLGHYSEGDYFDRVGRVDGALGLDGLGGNPRNVYSPGYVRQYLSDWAQVADCETKMDGFRIETPSPSANNHVLCFRRELDKDAVVIKMSWRRNDSIVRTGIPVHDTTAATLAKRVRGELDQGGWPTRGMPMRQAGPEDIYTVQLSGGERFSLVGLHIMTKELRHWTWVTLWWSPDADTDFGADRPAAIKALGGPWSKYKMCAVTDYEERDPDPRGGFDGTLGDALEATHGKFTWCSNPFIERGARNAQTNCIGCHQHAGDPKRLADILEDERTFPAQSRARVRASFPADYSWAFMTPDNGDQKERFFRTVLSRVRAYEESDR